MTQGFGGFLLLLEAGLGCGGGCMAGGRAGFRCVLLFLSIRMEIKISNSIKTKSTLGLYRKSLRSVTGIFAVRNDVFFISQRGFIYCWIDPNSGCFV